MARPDPEVIRSVTPEQARTLACPTCGAGAGEKCRTRARVNGVVEHRESNHVDRILVVARATVQDTRQASREPSSVAGGGPSATHEETRQVPCPECGAPAGQPCWGKRRADGMRRLIASHHSSRWHEAMKQLGRQVLAAGLADERGAR